MRDPSPDLLLTYLPHLDYDLQRYGPHSSQASDAFELTAGYLARLLETAERCDYQVALFGDYAIEPARHPIYPNQLLRQEGLFKPRRVKNMLYADLHTSPAFAMVDHQICHVITRHDESQTRARALFENCDGVDLVLGPDRKSDRGIDHPRSGDLVLCADTGSWFAYPWWTDDEKPPDYARHVDIHNKPGYDPAELFWGFWPFSTSQDADRINGTHGRLDKGTRATWATNIDFKEKPQTLLQLSQQIKTVLTAG